MSSDLDGMDAFDRVLDRAVEEAARSKVLQDRIHMLENDLRVSRQETSSVRNTLESMTTKRDHALPKLNALWGAADKVANSILKSPALKDMIETRALDKALVEARVDCDQVPF